jgi:glucose-6-phosphate-specific signal transduction histidine kinase
VADDIPPRSARRRSVIAEALTNAAKHARASTVSVQIEVAGDVLLLDVRDDGAGGGEFSRGTGLAGLKDRVEALGAGSSSQPAQGGDQPARGTPAHRLRPRRHYLLA